MKRREQVLVWGVIALSFWMVATSGASAQQLYEPQPQAPYVPRNQVCWMSCEQVYVASDLYDPGGFGAVERLVGELGLGLAAELLGTGLIYASFESADDLESAVDAVGVGLVVGTAMVFATPAAVAFGGDAFDGEGGYGWTLLGSLAGRSIGTAVAIQLSDSSPMLSLGLSSLLTVAGGIIAYELDHAGEMRDRDYARIDGIDVRPSIDLTADQRGAIVSISGRM